MATPWFNMRVVGHTVIKRGKHQYSIVNVCRTFFIHPSVSGHFVCFHVLAIVDSAAVNTGVRASF